jgi:hypothetical protein
MAAGGAQRKLLVRDDQRGKGMRKARSTPAIAKSVLHRLGGDHADEVQRVREHLARGSRQL